MVLVFAWGGSYETYLFFEMRWFQKFSQAPEADSDLDVDVFVAMVRAFIQQGVNLVEQIVPALKC